jgi:tRNA-splicing ligase RtcB
MITVKGKYNSANIMIDEVDDATLGQIQDFLNNPAFGKGYIAIMPDCHKGNGSCIGFTMSDMEYVIPSIVGVDIGCGMLMSKFAVKNVDLKKLDEYIKHSIPVGFSINETVPVIPEDLQVSVHNICQRIDKDPDKMLKAIGSLGGGNHFIEAGYDAQNNFAVTIHSGSRNFGLSVANFYQDKAKQNLAKYFLQDEYRGLEFLPMNSQEARDYMIALQVAQKFASENRLAMMLKIARFLDVLPVSSVESVHNFIGDDGIIRKGATPAYEGQKVLIPFNMRDGIAVCTGRGSKKYNYSAPHGAGRVLSRTAAHAKLSVEDFVQQMADAGVYTTTANKTTLDEAPDAYKAIDVILANIVETVRVDEFIVPVYNFKAGEESKLKKRKKG